MVEWARSLLAAMQPAAALFDAAHGSDDYSSSLAHQLDKLADPELTPSARVLREMRERDQSFFVLAMAYSERWAEWFRNEPMPAETVAAFTAESARSLADQAAIEASENVSFAEYLDRYYAQYRAL